ncbi:MAG: hypothetical protein A3G24_17825 [Betaproteobacteria bacterium RIFCSPLOWO2_12_FULL_62_13]|nr:MAG: hypothetical protein A3G24_17825 [Betaproteobacteria bacterium RIFCSPLOWO2_12_FULL_62_13]
MSILVEILQEISDGRKSFTPCGSSEADMVEFQPVAKALAYANSQGYLDGFLIHKESSTGNSWYDSVVVKNGLTHSGEEFLREPHSSAGSELDQIIQLKPEVYGVGIDLKALWRRWKNRKSGA